MVVDAATRDATETVARRYTQQVHLEPWRGYGGQRNLAVGLAAGEWVLFVDADERIVPALATEIRRAVQDSDDEAGFWIPRRNMICGQWVRWAGWWPDLQLRLLRRGRARYDESAHVHEVAELDGPAASLAQPIVHLNYETLREFRTKQRHFARLEARSMAERGLHARPRNLLLQPIRELRRRYLELGGYRQGLLGLQLSALMAEATFHTYRELLRLQQHESSRPLSSRACEGSTRARTRIDPSQARDDNVEARDDSGSTARTEK